MKEVIKKVIMKKLWAKYGVKTDVVEESPNGSFHYQVAFYATEFFKFDKYDGALRKLTEAKKNHLNNCIYYSRDITMEEIDELKLQHDYSQIIKVFKKDHDLLLFARYCNIENFDEMSAYEENKKDIEHHFLQASERYEFVQQHKG